jgi:hypothetical protein
MVLGYLWYGPLFGKEWARLMGFSHEHIEAARKKGMATQMVVQVVGALLIAFILDHALIFADAYLHISGLSAGIIVGFLNWLGFVAPTTVGMVLWEGKSWKLWSIVAGYWLVLMCIMGVIFSLWS